MLTTGMPKSRSTSDRRQLAIATLFAVQRDQNASGLGLLRVDDLHHFADSGASGDHVVDDQYVTGQRGADQAPAFAVILGFLAVEAPWHIELVLLGQRHSSGCGQGIPL